LAQIYAKLADGPFCLEGEKEKIPVLTDVVAKTYDVLRPIKTLMARYLRAYKIYKNFE